MKELQNIFINRGNSILVIVDMENDFCKPGGKVFRPPRDQTVPAVVSAIRDLAERVRDAGIPIIYIQSVRTLQEPEFTVFGGRPFLEQGGWGVEIIDELKPHQGDIIVQKHSHDCFYNTNMDEVLQRLVPDATKCYALVTGGGITHCVFHAVSGFFLRNYWTVVPVDCVVYTHDEEKQEAFSHFSRGFRNVFLSRSDLVEVSAVPAAHPAPIPGR